MVSEAVDIEALAPFWEDAYITEVLREVKSGKEGTVYCCRADPSTGRELLAAKMYRPGHMRTFKNDAIYREGRAVGKRREQLAFQKGTRKGKGFRVHSWIATEAAMLRTLNGLGADVPALIASAESALLMDYYGDEETAAPLLIHARLNEDEARREFGRILHNIEGMLRYDIVHGDLSPYNILYWQGRTVIIDFPQAVDPRDNHNGLMLLERDVTNVSNYFKRYGIKHDASRFTHYLWSRYIADRL